MPLSVLSYISIFGLSGIVVNDSIVLVSRIDERAADEGIFEAIVGGAKDRLRAIILTSITTIGGLLPLMFETSVQAQFLIPMAVTVVFGLAFSTFLLLFFVPALVAMQADIGLGWRLMFFDRRFSGDGPPLHLQNKCRRRLGQEGAEALRPFQQNQPIAQSLFKAPIQGLLRLA